MPLFQKNAFSTPFGRNVYLRSTQDIKTESGTLAAATVPARTIDGAADQKVLQPGTVLATITGGADIGKLGPFQAGATDGRQTAANIVGICNTFLPWQLMEGDREIAFVYEASVVQNKCIELDAAGAEIPLTNATRDGMLHTARLSFTFH